MTWFPVPRYNETRSGECWRCGPTLLRSQYAGPGIYGLICCRCRCCVRVVNLSLS